MTAEPESSACLYTVSVRELCEFTAKQGDLDLRFTPAPSAQEGIAGHAVVAARRGAGYEREVSLAETVGVLRVRGRADGFYPARGEVEEVKTFRGAFERIAENHRALHWAQAKMYAAMLACERGLVEVRVTLVYFDIVREKETLLTEVHGAAALRTFFEAHCERFTAWARQEAAHRLARNECLSRLPFPFDEFHSGQRTLAEAAYRTARDGGCLMAQAPTGIGKSVGTLFPTLKAGARGGVDKVFYLTAKTPGRRLALDALAQIDSQAPGRQVRVLELVAREKACEHPDKACHGESCPLARGFYDRLPAARQAALASPVLEQQHLRSTAAEHAVCPYFLSQELVRWADVVVADYNYYFDLNALLYALTKANDWRVALLVDEAHNLLERARGMYSSELDQDRHLAPARASAPVELATPLRRLTQEWNRVHRDQEEPYAVRERPPERLHDALGKLCAAITDHVAEAPEALAAELQTLHFEALRWRALAEVFAAHSIYDVTLTRSSRGRDGSRQCLRNIVPAPFLQERFRDAHSAVLFSATLAPAAYHREMLGLPEECTYLDVPSPFSPDQLEVRVVREVSTRYADRAVSLAPIVERIARQYRARPGNYLAFFSSFEYLDAVARAFEAEHPDIASWRQARGMSEPQRTVFLDRFAPEGRGIGFAVLGGAFAEGIDLPGSRLIGAFIATLGLPQVNPVNEQMKARLEELFGRGYDYAYLFPGLQKVAQAGGRVIRGLRDRGVLILFDDRYAWGSVRALLPSWWRVGLEAPMLRRPPQGPRAVAADHPPTV